MLARFPQIETLHTVSGKFDLIALVKTASSEAMDRLIDEHRPDPRHYTDRDIGHFVDKA